MNEYLSDDQVNSLLRKLNACYPDYFQWTKKKAQKMHVDLFSCRINEGDYYYRSKIDNNFSNDMKLSLQSMERLLYAIFANAQAWQNHSEQIVQDKLNDIRSIMNKLRPLK